MGRFVRYLVLALVVAGVALGGSQIANTQSSVNLVATIQQSAWGKFKIEAISMCSNGNSAWVASVGPGALDDFQLFKITGTDTASPKVDANSKIFFGDNDFFGPGPGMNGGTGLPAGMGPRGFPSIALDLPCTNAYIANPFLDSVIKVNLAKGIQATANNKSGSVNFDDGTIVWPADYKVDHSSVEGFSLIRDALRTIPTPIGVKLNSPADTRVIVSSSAGAVYVLDANSGAQLAKVATTGIGPGSLMVSGSAWAAVVENSRDLACIDLSNNQLAKTISGLGINPYMGVVSGDGSTAYISNQGSNTVSVLSGAGCNKSVAATIDVGNAPRYLTLSPDNKFLYVSNALDNTVSVISTSSLSVIDTIQVAGPSEPAPLGVLAVSGNNRYLYAYWEGGIVGTPGMLEILVYDVRGLYK